MERVDELRRELEELITRLITLSVSTLENFMNLVIEVLRKVSPVPLVIPQVVIPEALKRRSAEEAAKVLASLILAPLNPAQLVKLAEEVIQFAERIRARLTAAKS